MGGSLFIAALVANAVLGGTILNGRPVTVVTSFETEIGSLKDPDWLSGQ